MRRRDFTKLVGYTIAAWPLAARAQQPEQMRRIGVLMAINPDDAEAQARIAAFVRGLQELGWTVGKNVQIDYRLAGIDADNLRKNAAELVALTPDVILAQSSTAIAPLLQATRKVPIVFTLTADPVAAGYVESLAHPGGNATGFTVFDYSIGGKWLELLKEIAPRVTRVAVLRETVVAAGPAQFGAAQTVAPSLGMELRPVDARDADEIERAIKVFAQGANSGLLVTGSSSATLNRNLIIALAAQYRLPAVYFNRFFVSAGGLISYGPDYVDQFGRAAGYIHRILKGEKPGDLPVQAPTKYELVINLKTARALGLSVPQSLIVRADDVIE